VFVLCVCLCMYACAFEHVLTVSLMFFGGVLVNTCAEDFVHVVCVCVCVCVYVCVYRVYVCFFCMMLNDFVWSTFISVAALGRRHCV
jgi:hypothetical protein